MTSKDLQQLIDACRPGRNDPDRLEGLRPLADQLADDAELRSLLERSERFDAAVGRGMRQVPTPEGLEERIRRACEQAALEADVPPTETAPMPIVRAVPLGRRGLQAGLMAAAAMVLVGATVLVGLMVNRPHDTELTSEVAIARAEQVIFGWRDQEVTPQWRDLATAPPHLRPPSETQEASLTGWMSYTDFLGREVAIYRVELPQRRVSGILVVAPTFGTPRMPTVAGRLTGSGGVYGTAWHHGGHFFVLVLEGPPHQLERAEPPVLHRPRGVA